MREKIISFQNFNFNELAKSTLVTLMFFSRLPVYRYFSSRVEGNFFSIDRDAGSVPLASFIISLVMIFVVMICSTLSANLDFIALVLIASAVLVTGCLHEDGLADCADGFGGGHHKSRKLEIMKDSAIGSYGTIALIICFLTRFIGLVFLLEAVTPYDFCILLSLIFICSRVGSVSIAHFLPSAKDEGLGKSAGDLSFSSASKMWAITFGFVVLAMALTVSFVPLFIVFGTLLATIIAMTISRHHIGGYTGDVFGFTQIMAEITSLGALIVLL